jgi:glycine reductase
MKLQLNIVSIRDVQMAEETTIRAHVLHINREELRGLLLQDARFADIGIELARPGEKCRIVQVVDVIEPRAKADGAGENFPGIVGGQVTAGQGITFVLKGVAVVMSDNREIRELTTSRDPNGEIIEMYGPGAQIGAYGMTCNVVLLPTPAAGIGAAEYLTALKIAGVRTAAYLGSAAKGIIPDDTKVFELPPLLSQAGQSRLPKVAYIFQLFTHQFEPIPAEPVLYGKRVDGIAPCLIHPNEVLDGAITSPIPALNLQTYQIQNHAMIEELYQRHGKDLWFVGVVLATAPNNMPEVERVSHQTASLVANVLGVDGVVLTKTGGGAPELTMARTAQLCEQMGIKTVVALLHMGVDKSGAATIFNMPEVNAIVSMGEPWMELQLPAVDRVIGRAGLTPEGPAVTDAMVRPIRWIKGSQCQLGSSKLRAVSY